MHLDQEEPNARWLKRVEYNVARAIYLVLFTLADKRYILCNVANHRWLKSERL